MEALDPGVRNIKWSYTSIALFVEGQLRPQYISYITTLFGGQLDVSNFSSNDALPGSQ